MTRVADALGASSLFAALHDSLREEVGRLMSPVAFGAGEDVFRQGDPGHHLVVLESGRLEALLAVPGREPLWLSELVPGDVVGELSLLGDGHRTATVRATEASTGWALERNAFDALRSDLRPPGMAVVEAIGRRAVQRLDELYRRTGATLTGESAPLAPEAFGRATRVRLPDASYLLTTLFFRHVTETELETIVDGCRCLQLPRGEVLERGGEAPAALWIVLRGAVETAMRDTTSAHRLRLAGPGRVVGHVGLLGEHLHVERRESRARELAIVLEIPWPRVHELMASTDRAARRFASALWTDTVRALQHGERPLARMSVHHGAPAGGRRAA